MTEFRYLVDTTKKAMAAHPGAHVIIDSHAGGQVVALCPITEGNKPICEGDYSFAPLVQRALEQHGRGLANLATLSALVRAAFEEGRSSAPGADQASHRAAWGNSVSKARLGELMTGVPGVVNSRERGEFGEGVNVAVEPLSDLQIVTSPDHSPLDRIIAHGRLAHKDGW